MLHAKQGALFCTNIIPYHHDKKSVEQNISWFKLRGFNERCCKQ